MLRVLIAAILFSTSAIAQEQSEALDLICEFTTECIDDDCNSTTYEAELNLQVFEQKTSGDDDSERLGAELNPAMPSSSLIIGTFSDVFGTLDLRGAESDDAIRLSVHSESAVQIMGISSDMSARFVTLMPDVPMTITYLGTCKEAA